jgi:hypothetical protein
MSTTTYAPSMEWTDDYAKGGTDLTDDEAIAIARRVGLPRVKIPPLAGRAVRNEIIEVDFTVEPPRVTRTALR